MTKKVSTTVYLERRQVRSLQALKEQTGVPIASLVRFGIEAILEKNKHLIEDQRSFQQEWLPGMEPPGIK